jgi:hypothetical protein
VCRPLLASALDRTDNDLDREPDDGEIGDHLPGDHQPRRLGLGGDIAEPGVANTVTVNTASVRVSGWLKLLAEIAAMTT